MTGFGIFPGIFQQTRIMMDGAKLALKYNSHNNGSHYSTFKNGRRQKNPYIFVIK